MTVYVVGLDGADWSFLRPWMDEGALPGFARLCDEGVSGPLQSTLPPVTFPAWKCYSTGKTPGKLGVYEWFGFDRDHNEIQTNDSSDFRSREYWDVMAEHGGTPAVVNMPTTHPPNTDDGVQTIAGSPATERKRFTSPETLKAALLDAVTNYRVKPNLVLGETTPAALVREAKTLVDQRFDAAEWLAAERDCDLVHLTVFVTDTLQHRLWDRPERLRSLYQHVDGRLRTLLNADDTDAVFLMSDHGFVEIDEVFLVNQWLLERGDLVIGQQSTRSALSRVGLTRERLKGVVDRLGLVPLAQSVVPESAQRLFPSESGRVAIQDVSIDWEETRAFSLGRGPLYLNYEAFDSRDEATAYGETLVDSLAELMTPSGGPVVAEIHRPEDLYTGDLARAPDYVVEYAEGVDAPEAIGGTVFGEQTEWLATHRRSGLFGAWGDDIATGKRELSLYDLAPTLLHYLSCPVPTDVDGDVRTDVLTGDVADRAVTEAAPTAKDPGGGRAGDEVEETLRSLGYME